MIQVASQSSQVVLKSSGPGILRNCLGFRGSRGSYQQSRVAHLFRCHKLMGSGVHRIQGVQRSLMP